MVSPKIAGKWMFVLPNRISVLTQFHIWNPDGSNGGSTIQHRAHFGHVGSWCMQIIIPFPWLKANPWTTKQISSKRTGCYWTSSFSNLFSYLCTFLTFLIPNFQDVLGPPIRTHHGDMTVTAGDMAAHSHPSWKRRPRPGGKRTWPTSSRHLACHRSIIPRCSMDGTFYPKMYPKNHPVMEVNIPYMEHLGSMFIYMTMFKYVQYSQCQFTGGWRY